MIEDKRNSPPDNSINIEVIQALFADLKSNNHPYLIAFVPIF
jgi:hypothetical protein